MDEPKVCIVTPIHNGVSRTLRFLESVKEMGYPNLETIIVDDGSTDGSSEAIRRDFPETILLAGDGNLWWTAATNLGVREALSRAADFVFTVNNDVTMTNGAISSSVSCALRESPALIGSTVHVLEDPDQIWFAGARFNRRTGDIEHEREPVVESGGVREAQMLTGMGMLIPSEAFEHVGFFDAATFPHYLADCDFSIRAAQRGYRLLVTSESRLYNEIGSAWSVQQMERPRFRFLVEMIFSKRSGYWFVGRVRFYRRHWGNGKTSALIRLYVTWFRTYVVRAMARRLLRLRKARSD